MDYDLGGGGEGEVFKVTKKTTKEVFAMKTLKVKKSGSSLSMKNIASELEIGVKLGKESPFLVSYEEVFFSTDRYYIIMELCASDLEDILKKRITLPEPVILYFL